MGLVSLGLWIRNSLCVIPWLKQLIRKVRLRFTSSQIIIRKSFIRRITLFICQVGAKTGINGTCHILVILFLHLDEANYLANRRTKLHIKETFLTTYSTISAIHQLYSVVVLKAIIRELDSQTTVDGIVYLGTRRHPFIAWDIHCPTFSP